MSDMFAGFSFRVGRNRREGTTLQNAHQVILKDLVFKGDEVIEVGAAAAGNAVFLASLVGPRGMVHVFESNPVFIPLALGNLQANDISHIRLSNSFVCERQNEYASQVIAGRYRVSIHPAFYPRVEQSLRAIVEVRTETLDHYCGASRIKPSLVLISAGSAAGGIVEGARRLLRQYMPSVVILNLSGNLANNANPLLQLSKHGYTLYDGHSYAPLESCCMEGKAEAASLIVAVPRAFRHAHGRRWTRPPTMREYMTALLEPDISTDSRDVLASSFVLLPKGRWLLQVDFSAVGPGKVHGEIVDNSGHRRVGWSASIDSTMSPAECRKLVLDTDATVVLKVRLVPSGHKVRLHSGNLLIREVHF